MCPKVPTQTLVFSANFFCYYQCHRLSLKFTLSFNCHFFGLYQGTESRRTDTNSDQGNNIRKLKSSHESFSLIWEPGHYSMNGNEKADMLARTAAELEGAWNLFRRLLSCLSVVQSSAKILWQCHLENLHLHIIKSILSEWASFNHP